MYTYSNVSALSLLNVLQKTLLITILIIVIVIFIVIIVIIIIIIGLAVNYWENVVSELRGSGLQM